MFSKVICFSWIVTLFLLCQTDSRLTLSQHEDLTNSIKAIYLKEFQRFQGHIYFYVRYIDCAQAKKHLFEDLLNDVLYSLSGQQNDFEWEVHMHNPVQAHQYPHCNMVFVDNLQSLRYLYDSLRKVGTGNLSYTIIYIADLQHPNHRDLHRMLEYFWEISLTNVDIIMELPGSEMIMVSYYPFSDEGCELSRPVVINQYDRLQHRWQSEDYFPEKVSNFHQCKLIYASWRDMPYLWFSYDRFGRIVDLQGSEGKLVEYIAFALNASVDINILNEQEIVDIYNTSGWLFEHIFKRAHYSVGGSFYQTEPNAVPTFSSTKYYFITSTYFVTNTLTKLSSYEKLSFPFTPSVWIIIGMTLAIGCAVIGASALYRSDLRDFVVGRTNTLPYYNLFSALLGVTISESQLPQRNFARFLLMLWVLATLILRCAYQSGMYHLLRTDVQRSPPLTVAELLRRNYYIEMNEEYSRLLDVWPALRPLTHFTEIQEMDAFETLLHETDRGRAILCSYEYYGYFRKLHPDRILSLVRERVLSHQYVFYVRHNSYLVKVLDKYISDSENFGLSVMWKRMYQVGMDVVERKKQDPTELEPLALPQLQSIFLIFLWLQLVACVIFFWELTYDKWKRIQIRKHLFVATLSKGRF